MSRDRDSARGIRSNQLRQRLECTLGVGAADVYCRYESDLVWGLA